MRSEALGKSGDCDTQTREGKPQRLEAAFFNWMDFKD